MVAGYSGHLFRKSSGSGKASASDTAGRQRVWQRRSGSSPSAQGLHHRDPAESTTSCFSSLPISEVWTKLCRICFPGWRPKPLCGFVGQRKPRPSHPISQATPFEGRVSRQVSWTSRSAPSTRTGPGSNSSYVSKTVRRPGKSELPASFANYNRNQNHNRPKSSRIAQAGSP